jgi:hypothetical protein
MRTKVMLSFVLLACCFAASARAQEPGGDVRPAEPRVPLGEPAVAYDIDGRTVLAGRLRTTALAGTPDAPERNTRIVIESRAPVFYTYVSGWATFYGGDGVRCGEGLWKLEALAPEESAEVDTPGLRLTCTPTTWRIVALNLLTRTTDAAKPADQNAPPPVETPAPAPTPDDSILSRPSGTGARLTTRPVSARALPPLELDINGRVVPIQPGNPLEVVVGSERVRIILRPAP